MTNRGPVLVLGVAFLAGLCTMAVELAAVRLLAPWFGTSSAVWTNVIGVVLLALSIGYLAGARASSGPRPARSLAFALGLGAVCAALLPVASAPVARLFLPSGLALDEAGTLVRWGSLATAACLFLPPAALLGCVAPLCCEILERMENVAPHTQSLAASAGSSAGRAGGAVLCASTLGSLLGTFGTTYVLVPELGLTWTFVGAGVLLAVLALLALFALATPRVRGPSTGVVALCAIAGLGILLPRARVPDPGSGMQLLEARESTYQSVRVVESQEANGERMRFLQVNESFDSFQSVWQPAPGLLPVGYYYNAFALPLWWSRDVHAWRVAVVGLGAGTAWRVLDGARPPDTTLDLVGAEIDPVVVEMAQRWMDLPVADPRCRVLSGRDGRAALRAIPPGLDLVVLDAYANQMEIPPHLASVEFFREVRGALRSGGWVDANVGGFGFDDPVVDAVARTLAVAFERRVLAVRVPFSRNVALFVRRDAEPPEPGTAAWTTGNTDLDQRMAGGSLPGTWRWYEPGAGSVLPGGAAVLTDDLDPIEDLQRRSIEMAAEISRQSGAP